MKEINNINKAAALNIASTVLLRGISFFTTPLFTRILGTTQYGLYSVYYSWVSIFSCIMGLGTGSVLGTGMYTFKGEYYRFRSSTLLQGTLVSMALMVLIMPFAPLVGQTLGYSAPLLGSILILSFANYVIGFYQGACVYEKKAADNVAVALLTTSSSVVLSLLLTTQVQWTDKYLGRVYGMLIPYVIIGAALWFKVFFKARTWLRSEYCRFAFSMGFPVVFHSLAQSILSQSDRVMMQLWGLPSAEIGIYSLFYSLATVLSTVLSALNVSWCPYYYEDLDAQAWQKLDKKCKNYLELFTVLAVGFTLLAREVSYVMADESYHSGLDVIPVIVLAVYFTFMYQFPVNFEFFHKQTKIVAMGTVGAGLLNIVLNACMIPAWGMYGAAAATALSYGALFAFHYAIVKSMTEHPYHLKARAFLPGLLAVAAACVLYYGLADAWYLRWLMGAVIGVVELLRICKRRTIF